MEYATLEEARTALKPGYYLCGGVTLKYRVLPVPAEPTRKPMKALIDGSINFPQFHADLEAAGYCFYQDCAGNVVIRTKAAADAQREHVLAERRALLDETRAHEDFIRRERAAGRGQPL